MNRAISEEIFRSLRRHYGEPNPHPSSSFWEGPILGILSQNASFADAQACLKKLNQLGVDLHQLHTVAVPALEAIIRPIGQAKSKARSLRRFFIWIERDFEGSWQKFQKASLTRLREGLLEAGIGKETTDLILLHGLGQKVFPISPSIYRVLRRHYLLEEESDYERAREIAENLPDDESSSAQWCDAVLWLQRVGKDFCHPQAECPSCPLRGINWDGRDSF